MRELEPKIVDPKEIEAVKPIKREKLVVTLRPKPGQKVWEFDLKTRIIQLATFEETNANFVNASKGDFSIRRKVLMRDGCIYTCAINAENADKKFFKMLGLKKLYNKKNKPKEK